MITFIEKFGESITPNDIRRRFREIKQDKEELVPSFNLRFMKAVNNIPKYLRPSDAKCLLTYLGTFDNKMSDLIRDKEPTTWQ